MEARPPLLRHVAENLQPLIFAACIIAIVAFIGVEIWSTVQGFSYRPTVITSQNRTAGANPQPFVEQITAADLFGHSTSQGNLPETNLQLTLRAVFAAQDPHQASAVIEMPDGRAQVIKAGASISGDAMLQEVHENRVVLSRNGVMETLFFPAPQESSDFAIAQNTPAPQTDTDVNAVPNNSPAAGASPDEIKRAAILQRLEELRARSSR
ncbi:MAG: hypothetical protein JWM78_2973 [Verrucomicrobiaceae bacterium]|nr:hypothetical protein [Verrucomicrobiaceae bacterium]